MSRSYYSDEYYGRSNGWIAVVLGAAMCIGFCWYADYSAVRDPLTKAEEEMERSKRGNSLYGIEAAKKNLAEQQRNYASGQLRRDQDAYVASRRTGTERSTGDWIWSCIAGFGLTLFGWRTVRGVASPFEVLLAIVCGIATVILAASFGIVMFILLCVCGALILMAFKALGDDCINRTRWVRDEYDEDFGVNERRAQRRRR